ncbi:Phage protein U [Buttiauxella agrestis]|uniref:Phage protein U n=1 Tax=Buttiauxella agrestis TaxID=82977 RepID=A0A381C5T8_9ENTR|nr:phage tail protein [Buttiauxella agrestis]SUW63294.1 Phage protein U [Buttiauxella agrestis]
MNIDPLALIGANIREQTENYLDQLPPLMMWGDFIFQLSTLAYSKLTVQDSWNWVAQGRFGKRETLQYTGKKSPTIKFDCELYSELVNSSLLTRGLQRYGLLQDVAVDPVEHLRLQGDLKAPCMLVTGAGKVMGFWVLTGLDQTIDEFKPNSHAKHQTISLSMQFYGPRLNESDAVPEFASLGFTSKESKMQDALKKMNDFLEEHGVG